MPIVVKREIPGFILNRLQAALAVRGLPPRRGRLRFGRGHRQDDPRRPGPALVVHGAVRDDRPQRAGRRARLRARATRPIYDGDGASTQRRATWARPALRRRLEAERRAATAAPTDLAERAALARPAADGARGPQAPLRDEATTRTSSGASHGQRTRDKVIITCAVTGAIHTPTMSPHLPITPDEIAEARDRRGARRARRSCTCTRASPKDGRPTQDPGGVHAVPAEDQGGDRRGHQPHHRRRADHDASRSACSPRCKLKPEVASLNMGSMNFGLYEMIAALQGVEARLGAALPRRLATSASSRTPSRTSRTSCRVCSEQRHALRDRVLRHRPPLHRSRTSSSAGWSSRRCSSSRCSASAAASAPHPEDVLHMKRTADRLFGDQYHWSVLGAGRNQMYIATQSAVDGRQCARRARGQPVDRQGPAREDQRRAGREDPPHPRGAGAGGRHARTRRAAILKLKGKNNVNF